MKPIKVIKRNCLTAMQTLAIKIFGDMLRVFVGIMLVLPL